MSTQGKNLPCRSLRSAKCFLMPLTRWYSVQVSRDISKLNTILLIKVPRLNFKQTENKIPTWNFCQDSNKQNFEGSSEQVTENLGGNCKNHFFKYLKHKPKIKTFNADL